MRNDTTSSELLPFLPSLPVKTTVISRILPMGVEKAKQGANINREVNKGEIGVRCGRIWREIYRGLREERREMQGGTCYLSILLGWKTFEHLLDPLP